jgi:hypothetical protein
MLRTSSPKSVFEPRSLGDGGVRRAARFGVGYDTVDVGACTEAGIALIIAPKSRPPPCRCRDHHFHVSTKYNELAHDQGQADARSGVRLRAPIGLHGCRADRTHLRIIGCRPGLDVIEHKPPDSEDPILGLDNAILAPHTLCYTDQLSAVAGQEATDAILQFLAGGEPRGTVVNSKVFSRTHAARRS